MNYRSTFAMNDEELAALAKRLPMSDLVAMANHTEVHGALAVACVPHEKTFQLAVRLNAAARAELDRRLPIPATVEPGPPVNAPWRDWAEHWSTRWEELCAALNLGALPSHEQALARVEALVTAEKVFSSEVGGVIAERDEARAEVARLRGEAAGLRVEMNAATSERDSACDEVERLRTEAAKAKATAEQMFDRWAALCDVLGYGRAFRHEARAGLPTVEDVHRAALARLREWSGAERAETPLWQELCRALGVTGPGALDAANREAAHKEALSEIRGLRQLERDVEEERDRPFWTRPR